MSGTDLVLSGSDLEAKIREQFAEKLEAAQVNLAAQRLEDQVQKHYEKRAKKIIKKLWRECGARTGHVSTRGDESTCEVCGKPITRDYIKGRTRNGITKLAWELRNADKRAGIEWIPKK